MVVVLLLLQVPIFAKGANFVPMDSFENRVSDQDMVQLVQDALDANMNVLRFSHTSLSPPRWELSMMASLNNPVSMPPLFCALATGCGAAESTSRTSSTSCATRRASWCGKVGNHRAPPVPSR